MWGKGRRSASTPPCPFGTSRPSVSTTAASTPGNATPTAPGRAGMQSGVPSAGPPSSVCHQLSATKPVFPPPTRCWKAHRQASGFSGSPATASSRREERSDLAGSSSPNFMNIRSAVGAVKMTFTRCFSTSRQAMAGSG